MAPMSSAWNVLSVGLRCDFGRVIHCPLHASLVYIDCSGKFLQQALCKSLPRSSI